MPDARSGVADLAGASGGVDSFVPAGPPWGDLFICRFAARSASPIGRRAAPHSYANRRRRFTASELYDVERCRTLDPELTGWEGTYVWPDGERRQHAGG